MRLFLWALLLLGATGLAHALEEVALPPGQLSARAVAPVSTCETQFAKMADGRCPYDCMVKEPTVSLTTSAICTLTGTPWSCVWPRQSVTRNGYCPTGWEGTLGRQVMYEIRRCGAAIAEVGSSVTTSNCFRRRLEDDRRACPLGWDGPGITYVNELTERLAADMKTVTLEGALTLPLTDPNRVQCFKDLTTTTRQPCASNRAVQSTVTTTVRQRLAVDLVSVASTTTLTQTATACPTPPAPPKPATCGEFSPGARCVNGWWTSGGGGNYKCIAWVCDAPNNKGSGPFSGGGFGKSHDTGEHGNRFGGAGGKF
jgi:hypothetical protein